MSKLDKWIIEKEGLVEGTRKELEQLQLNRWNQLLAYCRRNEYYQYLPEHIDALEQVKDIPLCDETTVAEQGHRLLCVSQGEIQRIVTMDTSGSTGKAKRFFFTQEDLALTVDFFQCGLSEVVDAGDRMLILMPYEKEGSVGALIMEALARLKVEAYPCRIDSTFYDMAKLEVWTLGWPVHCSENASSCFV